MEEKIDAEILALENIAALVSVVNQIDGSLVNFFEGQSAA